ncbi:Gfo/Idh/MocA family protein [Streptomyces hainanensis]|uniref:Gfo/Idh/MocA family oxidoreductase n=1 Tax=Streptomyces hainanensis TaxID=402648 RepID=A0A4R4TDJ6_9ACTN|nr:Gfo/Idh/MocA family oxidoreductase [Streptomyces hainanensis]TDC75400.1 Gfo/Idh/MocA family oxidoreductase [Streptomyces hainanensis]
MARGNPPDGARPRTRYALIGTGERARDYVRALLGDHRETAELVALLDAVPLRLDRFEDYVKGLTLGGRSPVRYGAGGLERMIDEQKIDRVILTTPDATHADLTCRSLLAGADVIVEAPLTTDATGGRRIAGALEASGRHVVVAFNRRYAAGNAALREVLAAGGVGRITGVRAAWPADAEASGQPPRSSHHFDLVNWWLDDAPARVAAGADEARGVTVHYRGGATLTHAPTAPGEPSRVVVDGTEGQAELVGGRRLTVRCPGKPDTEIPIPATGDDGDAELFRALFHAGEPVDPKDPLCRAADTTDGLHAAAVELAAAHCLAHGLAVDLAEPDPARA